MKERAAGGILSTGYLVAVVLGLVGVAVATAPRELGFLLVGVGVVVGVYNLIRSNYSISPIELYPRHLPYTPRRSGMRALDYPPPYPNCWYRIGNSADLKVGDVKVGNRAFDLIKLQVFCIPRALNVWDNIWFSFEERVGRCLYWTRIAHTLAPISLLAVRSLGILSPVRSTSELNLSSFLQIIDYGGVKVAVSRGGWQMYAYTLPREDTIQRCYQIMGGHR